MNLKQDLFRISYQNEFLRNVNRHLVMTDNTESYVT